MGHQRCHAQYAHAYPSHEGLGTFIELLLTEGQRVRYAVDVACGAVFSVASSEHDKCYYREVCQNGHSLLRTHMPTASGLGSIYRPSKGQPLSPCVSMLYLSWL